MTLVLLRGCALVLAPPQLKTVDSLTATVTTSRVSLCLSQLQRHFSRHVSPEIRRLTSFGDDDDDRFSFSLIAETVCLSVRLAASPGQPAFVFLTTAISMKTDSIRLQVEARMAPSTPALNNNRADSNIMARAQMQKRDLPIAL